MCKDKSNVTRQTEQTEDTGQSSKLDIAIVQNGEQSSKSNVLRQTEDTGQSSKLDVAIVQNGEQSSKSNVLVTRQTEQAIDMMKDLSANGHEPYLLPMIETVELSPVIDCKKYDIIIFTSTNACRYFQKYKDTVTADRYIAVGAKTAEACKIYLSIDIDFYPETFSMEFIKDKLLSEGLSRGTKILLPGAKERVNRDDSKLIERGIELNYLSIYETIFVKYEKSFIDNFLLDNKIDTLTFCSPSSAKSFIKQIENINYKDYKVVSIGKTTSDFLNSHNIENVYPKIYTVDEMIKLI